MESSLPHTPKGWRKRALPILVTGIAGLLTVAGLALVGSWIWYRLDHAVVRNATVKGRVHRIGPRIEGQVAAIAVVPGQQVRRGELLVRMESSRFLANLGQAHSELQSAMRRHEAEKLAIEHEARRLEVELERCNSLSEAASAEVEAAMSMQEKWGREYSRVEALVAQNVASSSELEKVTAERDQAVATAKISLGNLAAAEATCRSAHLQIDALKVREAGLEVLSAEVERCRQRVAAAESDLDATVLRAPDDGWVIQRIVEVGGSVKVGESVLSLWLGSPWVEAWMDEEDLREVHIGSPVDISLKAFPDARISGRVESIGVLTDREAAGAFVPATLHALFPRNAMVPIHIALDATDLRFQPGLSAVVGIRRGQPRTNPSTARDSAIAAVVPSPAPAGQ